MLIITITDSDKSVDVEEYMFFRMNREKMAGENLREGNMEVAFELWIERDRAGSDTPGRIPSRLQRRFPPLSGKAISEAGTVFPYCTKCRSLF